MPPISQASPPAVARGCISWQSPWSCAPWGLRASRLCANAAAVNQQDGHSNRNTKTSLPLMCHGTYPLPALHNLFWGQGGCSVPHTPRRLPLFRDDHIGALLAVRGDASRDMKQTIIETLEHGPMQASPNYVPIFKEIMVSSLNMAKLLK